MPISEMFTTKLKTRLQSLYGEQADAALQLLSDFLSEQTPANDNVEGCALWDATDIVLIAYGRQVEETGSAPLQTLAAFLRDSGLQELISTIHFLPFFPYSSDDGFSVIDYYAIDSELGTWDDVAQFRANYQLMFDLVLNHCSQQSEWFQNYLQGKEPAVSFFHEVDPATDLSAVMRPRSHPVLTPFITSRGEKYLWTTFSEDQLDLNFENPALLAEMIKVFMFYVARGAHIIRLDAIAYLWKEPGTTCIHLPQVHTVVKLLRDILDAYAPQTILLTETNVPHAENVSYFGQGDEARMVYKFSLAPLLLDAFLSVDTRPLCSWLRDLEATAAGNTYFNFTASHDGIGVRPLEGLVCEERIQNLVTAVQARGGRVSMKRNSDGSESPYELNITWFSAMGEPDGLPIALHVRRFLSSQAFMLALRGIPGIYFHSLVGSPNDEAGLQTTGRARSINRHTYEQNELQQQLAATDSAQSHLFAGYTQLLSIRIKQQAFHPDAAQQVVDFNNAALAGFVRTSCDLDERVLVIINTDVEQKIDLTTFNLTGFTRDLLTNNIIDEQRVTLSQYGVVWLK